MKFPKMENAVSSDTNPARVDINVKDEHMGINRQSVVLDHLKQVTKGDGAIRTVTFQGATIPKEFVQDSMFRNQDFMYHDEIEVEAKPNVFDLTKTPQRSHFGPMPPNPLGLGFDVIKHGKHMNYSIAESGGRFEE